MTHARALFALVALLAATPALPGCSLYQAYAQRRAIEQAQFHLRGVALEGADFGGVTVTVTLELENPTEAPIALDRLDYTLYISDRRAFSGYTPTPINVPGHDARPLPIRAYVRFSDLGDQVRNALVNGGADWRYRLEGVGHFDTPVGTIDYPFTLSPRP